MRLSQQILLETDIVSFMEEYIDDYYQGAPNTLVHSRAEIDKYKDERKVKDAVEAAKKSKNINSALKAATVLSTALTGGALASSSAGSALKAVSAALTASIAATTAIQDKAIAKKKKEEAAKAIEDKLEDISAQINSSRGEKRPLLQMRDMLKSKQKEILSM